MIASNAAGHWAASRILVNLRTAVAIAAAAAAAMISGCSASPAASRSAQPAAAAAPAGGCTVDAMKICKEAEAAGTLEAAPMTMGAASTQAALPRTARIEIPGGPAVQAMCYYDPQHKTVTRADWTATATLDAKAIAYLKDKKLCTGP
jgi:hypothetical protein